MPIKLTKLPYSRFYVLCIFIIAFSNHLIAQCDIPQVALNQCISHFKTIHCNNDSISDSELQKLVDATDETKLHVDAPVRISLKIDAENTTSEELILHWRGDSFKSRGEGNNNHSFQKFYILTSTNSINGISQADGDWTVFGPFTNDWQDNYIVFPNTKPKWVMVREDNNVALELSRLEIFTKAPSGLKDDIWMFLGDSQTNSAIIVGTQHDEAIVFFGDEIYEKTNNQYYPIIINAGFGGETAEEASGLIQGLLADHPEVTFVPMCYGLNDVIGLDPYPHPPIMPFDDNWESYENHLDWKKVNYYSNMVLFQNSLKKLINTCYEHDMFPIPARMPWAFYPNSYFDYTDPTNDKNNPIDTWGTQGTTPFNELIIDPIIKELAPRAFDFTNNRAIANFETWFHANAYDPDNLNPNIENPNIFKSDKLHFWKKGTDAFNTIWAETADQIVYQNQDESCCIKLDVSSNVMLGSSSQSYGVITIKDGGKLTISAEAQPLFCSIGKIIVEDNGILELEEGVILKAEEAQWRGIELMGAHSELRSIPNVGQPGRIEASEIGIKSWTPLNTPILINNFEFVNNDISISLYRSDAILTGCVFSDDRPKEAVGIGIRAIDSKLKVLRNIDNLQRTKFSNLKYGVQLDRVYQNEIAEIEFADFNLCGVGMQIQNVSAVKIRHNHFVFGENYSPAGDSLFQEYQYGIILAGGMLGCSIAGNVFDFDNNNLIKAIGIQSAFLGENEYLLKSNDFSKMAFANISFGVNASNDGISGLKYICNKNSNNKASIVTAMDPMLKKQQGGKNKEGFMVTLANQVEDGNKWDFYHQGADISYYYLAEKPKKYLGLTLVLGEVSPDCSVSVMPIEDDLSAAAQAENENNYLDLNTAYILEKEAWQAAVGANDATLAKVYFEKLSYLHEDLMGVVDIGYRASLKSSRSEIRKWIDRFNSFSADLVLIGDFAQAEDWTQVNSILDNIIFKYELTSAQENDLEKIKEVYALLKNKNVTNLSTEIKDQLSVFAQSGKGYASNIARSIMNLYGNPYQPLGLAQDLIDILLEANEIDVEQEKLVVSPNPARSFVQFEKDYPLKAEIVITNLLGQNIERLKMNGTNLQWDVQHLSQGVYIYQLIVNGTPTTVGKIIIN